jgi:hypothetical protein
MHLMSVIGMRTVDPTRSTELQPDAMSRWVIGMSVAFTASVLTVRVVLPSRRGLLDGLLLSSPAALAVIAFLAALVAMLRRRRSRPTGFVVCEGVAFVAVATDAFGFQLAGHVFNAGFVSGIVILAWQAETDSHPDTDLIWNADRTVMSLVLALLWVAVAVIAVSALRGRPRIELTPQGVLAREPWGTWTVPWDSLRPGLPWRTTERRVLTLTVDRPDLLVRRGLVFGSRHSPRAALASVRVHPWFLADGIRFYVDHAERRAGIGTQAEYERLLADLPGEWEMWPGPVTN